MPATPNTARPSRYADIVGGLTTFVTMAYIVVVNPSILASPGTGLPFSGAMTATVVLASAMTLLMGVYGRLPFAVAPGMGLNAFFAYTLVLQHHVPWPTALGMVFWAGMLFLLVSTTPLRERIAEAIPPSLRAGSAAGIGLLLTLLGLRSAGLVEADTVTMVRAGVLDHRAWFTVGGLVVATVLLRRENPLAFLAAIAGVTATAWGLGYAARPSAIVSAPDFSSAFLRLDVLGALQLSLAPGIVTIMFTDLFDSLSTFVGVSTASGLTDADGQPRHLRRGLIVDACATVCAGLVGTSPGTAFVESIAGIRVGARTGLASVVTAACFVPCLFIAPLAAAVPGFATAPVLLLVGLSMFHTIATVERHQLEQAVPAFVTMALIPLTLSITQGVLWGFVLHAVLYAALGRGRDVSPTLWALAFVSTALLVYGH